MKHSRQPHEGQRIWRFVREVLNLRKLGGVSQTVLFVLYGPFDLVYARILRLNSDLTI